MSEEAKWFIKLILIMIFVVNIGLGIISGVCTTCRQCSFNSIISRLNIGYVIGCELGKQRFKKELKK